MYKTSTSIAEEDMPIAPARVPFSSISSSPLSTTLAAITAASDVISNASSRLRTNDSAAASDYSSVEYNYEEEYDPLLDQNYVIWSFASSCVLLAFCVFGIASNVICAMIFMHPKMLSPINGVLSVILTGHCAIDMAVCLLAIPLLVLHALNTQLFSVLIEQIVAYSIVYLYPFAMSAKTCSVWTSVLITFERYMAVCHPLKARDIFETNKRASVAILVLVFVSVCYNFIRFWEYKLVFTENDQPMPEFVLRGNPLYYRIYYTGLYLVTHFMVPFAVLILLNTRIILTIAAAKKQRERLSRQELREHRTASMLVVLILLFIFTNSLPFIMNITEAITPQFFKNAETKLAATVILDLSNTLVVVNSSAAIFIYFYFSTKFRVLFKSRFLQCRSTPLAIPMIYMTTAESVNSLNELVPPKPIAQLVEYFRRLGGLIYRASDGMPSRRQSTGAQSNSRRRIVHQISAGSLLDNVVSARTTPTQKANGGNSKKATVHRNRSMPAFAQQSPYIIVKPKPNKV